MTASRYIVTRYVLGGLLAFVAVNAFAGGYFGLTGAEGVPIELLEGTPFDDYRIPSIILIVAVGGSCAAAALAVFVGLRPARRAAIGAALVVLTWLAFQVAMIGYVSWMQPTTALIAVVIVALASVSRLP